MKKHRFDLTTKYVVVVCVLLLTLNVTLGMLLMSSSGKSMKALIRRSMLSVADTVAAELDGDALGAINENSIGTPEYEAIYSSLSSVLTAQKDNDIKYIYTVRKSGDHFIFVIDPDPVSPGQYGDPVVDTDSQAKAWNDGVSAVDESTYQDKWGNFYTAWSPVKDSSGRVTALVGVDFVADWFDSQIAKHTLFIVIGSVLSLIVGAVIMLLLTGQLRRRIRTLNSEIQTFSEDVEKLTDEIAARPGYEDAAPDENVSAEPGDTIGELGGRIHTMRRKLRAYMQYAHKQAYTDSMTGVGNKTAYLDRVRELNSEINNGTAAFAIAVFDVNGLKNTNDNYGHECGDRVIIDAAKFIRRVFADEQIFRIGGDEFIVLSGETTEDELQARLAELRGLVEDFNENEKRYAMTLSFSGGGTVYRPGRDADFKEVFKRADEAMYRNKGEYYRQFGDRRATYDEDEAKRTSEK